MISYDPLWETMKLRGETTYTLINKHGLNARTIFNLKHNRSITMYTLERLCQILNCQAEGIVCFIPDNPK
jgi:DNA-binding Xre family transcriptional regulator